MRLASRQGMGGGPLRTMLAMVAGLAAAPVAMAQDDAAMAESRRLAQEVRSLAERGAWPGVERSYLKLRELGQPLDAVVHLQGAQAAQARGDAQEVRARVEEARAAGGSDVPELWLEDLASNYGEAVLIAGDSGSLQVERRPFSPDRAAAVDFAAAAIDRDRRFEGLLPAGVYFLGAHRFDVTGGEPVRVDLSDGQGTDCEQVGKANDLVAVLLDAEGAWLDVDVERFNADMASANRGFPCIDEEIQQNVAARMHRFIGLQSYVTQDFTMSDRAFGAARFLEPRYRFPTTMIPPGTAVEAHYEAIDIEDRETVDIAAPAQGWIQLDGRLTLKRPRDLPVIVQLFDQEGGVSYSGYLRPRQPMPSYTPLPPGARASVVYDKPGVPVRALVVGGGAVVTLAGTGFYAAGLSSRGKIAADDVRVDDLDRLRSQANTLGGVGVATAAVGLALVGTGLLVEF